MPRIVVTPNPYGSDDESNSSTPDHEAFIVSIDEPPLDGETESQEEGRIARNQNCVAQQQQEQADAQQQPVANADAAGDQRQQPRYDHDNPDQGGAQDKRRRLVRACNVLADLEQASHNILATP